jgi:hypothetical protein
VLLRLQLNCASAEDAELTLEQVRIALAAMFRSPTGHLGFTLEGMPNGQTQFTMPEPAPSPFTLTQNGMEEEGEEDDMEEGAAETSVDTPAEGRMNPAVPAVTPRRIRVRASRAKVKPVAPTTVVETEALLGDIVEQIAEGTGDEEESQTFASETITQEEADALRKAPPPAPTSLATPPAKVITRSPEPETYDVIPPPPPKWKPNMTAPEKRDLAINYLQQSFVLPGGAEEVRKLQRKLKIKKFSDVPDDECDQLLAEADVLFKSLRPQAFDASAVE